MLYLSTRRSVVTHLGRSSLGLLLILSLLGMVFPGIAHASSDYGNCAVTHSVQAGQTLTEIAAHFGLSVDELAHENHLDDANYIYESQELCIPSGDRGYDNGYDMGGPDNGYDKGGYDNGNGYRGPDNGYDKGGYDNGNGYRGYDNGYDKGGYDSGYGYRGPDSGYDKGGPDNGYGYRGPDSGYDDGGPDSGYDDGGYDNGYDKGGYDNGYGYRGPDNGYDNSYDKGNHGRDPRMYGSVEWSRGNEDVKNGYDNGNGYRGYDNGYDNGSYGKPFGGPGYEDN